MNLVYEVDENKWDAERNWLHSVMPWTKSKRDWHWRFNNNRRTYSVRIKDPDPATELLLKLSRPVKVLVQEWW